MLLCICLAMLAAAANGRPIVPSAVTLRLATAMCPLSTPPVRAPARRRSPQLIVSRAAFTSSHVRQTVAQYCRTDTGEVFVGTSVNLMTHVATVPTLVTPAGDGLAVGIDERHGRLRLGICILSSDSVVSYSQTPWLKPDDLVSTTFSVADTQQVVLMSASLTAMDSTSGRMATSELENLRSWRQELSRIVRPPGLVLRGQDPPQEAKRIITKRLFK